ncbi:hypothetical protein GCM10023143_16890 [Compostibacter hankyongensis]|uniref:Recombinase zinc beta ribbon domain-containing protein n=1 Tax=Compostibacter hankyongensis TaxID=1007089 RepID=A0ABP8FQV5_9BACT
MASGSKGRNKRYYYYHCTSACGYRVRAEEINEYFFQGIERLSTNEEYIELYKEIIKATFQELFHQKKIDQAYITKSIDKLIERSAKGKELLTKGDIDIDDYLAIKDDCETKINTLGEELHKAYILGVKKDQDLDQIAMQLTDLKSFYTSKEIDLTAKRQLSALLLKEKLIFDTAGFSNNLNEVAQIIYGLSVEKYAIQIKAKAGEGSPDLRENKSPYKAIVSRIEKRSGQVISSALFTRLHHFLTEFARLCISIKTGYQPHFSS